MKINPMTKVSTLKQKFIDEFGVEIKCHKGMSKGHIADDDAKVHEICTGMGADRDFEIELNGNMLVSTVEKEVADSLGFLVQVLNPDGSNADNGSTLASLRKAY
ncbi:MAG: hypothetical protein H8E83_00235 [Planctomycetes bacterium]|nr:hypothetical protein [Planctomycetota bacterium]